MLFRLLVLTVVIVSSTAASAQTFITIGTDKAHDVNPPGYANDVKTLSYAVDKAKDSLWFRIGSYDKLQGDFGFAIGLDTDNNTTNGHAWGGANTSMHYDLVVFLDRDVIDTSVIYGGLETGPSRPTGGSFAPRVVDASTVEVRLKLSEITSKGVLHVVAGSGSFDVESVGDIYDDIPDHTYVTLDLNAGVTPSDGPPADAAALYPNPCAGRLTIGSPEAAVILRVTDAAGREVIVPAARTPNGIELATGTLPDGIYLLTYRSEGMMHTEKFAVRK